jgi:aryl-alcohol dehydrogenase-like predicted oxidoreductase
MDFRYLGNSGLKVSEISYGNWLTHGSQVENEQAKACVKAALEAGITTFDTADTYANTKAESVLGEALAGVRRESVEILTKVYWPTGPGGPNDTGLSRKHIHESINASLKRLQTDYVDVYQAHRYDFETPLEETMGALTEVVRQGKVRYLGFSEWPPDRIQAALDLPGVEKFVSSQPQYSILWREPEREVFPLCAANRISQIVWSPLAQGTLTGKYKPGEPPPAGSRAASRDMGWSMDRFRDDDVLEAVQRLEPIAEGLGITMAQLALAWVLRRPEVAAAIIGASRPEQVEDNAAASGVELDEATLQAIDEAVGSVVAA